MHRIVRRQIRHLDEKSPTNLNQVLLPILQRLAWERWPETGPALLAL
jgi:hypothetical protein